MNKRNIAIVDAS